MKVIENGILPMKGFKAMTVLNMIFVRRGVKLSDRDINHEAIHWEQEKELLVVFFYVLYVLMFLCEVVRCVFDRERGGKRSLWRRAYRSIAFEREAYANECDLGYVKVRKRFAWI